MAQARRRSGDRATVSLTIDRIGGRGDGIAEFQGRPVYVPFTAPGDEIRARLEGRRGDGQAATLTEILAPGPDRQAPACRHFGQCGGCALQHLKPEAYRAWVRERVRLALAHQGLGDVPVAQPLSTEPGGRRRAALAVRRTARGVVLGFHARRSHRIVDLAECPVLSPDLAGLIPPLRDLLARVLKPGEGAAMALAALDGGRDVTITADREPGLAVREALAAFAQARDLARLSWQSGEQPAEPVAQRRPCTLRLGDVPVAVPPGAFLQASLAGERALVGLVAAAVDGAARIADLFAGIGTFSFPMAERCPVHAVEVDDEAIAALRAAANGAGLAGRVTAEARNLFRDPLTPDELARFDAVVFDPPRAGAAAQAEQLAASRVPVVVGVSCNPVSFARDAACLVGGGYRLEAVTPVDQFLWSEHVELVGVFRRP